MKTVGITELKNRLSYYLEDVQRGEEVLIRDRNKPIAKIVPLPSAGEFSEEELALAAAGILRLPEQASLAADLQTGSRSAVTAQDAINAVVTERRESRY